MKNKILALILLATLSSCSITTFYAENEQASITETKPEDVKLYSNDIQKEYTVLGSIAVYSPGEGEAAEKCIKKKASKIGADAIIFCKLSKIASSNQATGISGVAVKLK
jgi:hypothetical protein